jgi:hypothetical protein
MLSCYQVHSCATWRFVRDAGSSAGLLPFKRTLYAISSDTLIRSTKAQVARLRQLWLFISRYDGAIPPRSSQAALHALVGIRYGCRQSSQAAIDSRQLACIILHAVSEAFQIPCEVLVCA